MRHKALELLNTATEVELNVVKGMTSKKFVAVESLRPFSSWYDAVSSNSGIVRCRTIHNSFNLLK